MPYTLNSVFYIEQNIKARSDHDSASISQGMWNAEWWDQPGATDSSYLQFVKLEQTEASTNPKHDCHVVLFGIVETGAAIVEHTPETKAQAAMILQQLIGMAREKIRILSADSPWGAIIVPPIAIT